MALIDKGRVCVITKGSDAGKVVVVNEVMDKNFVKISGERVKERRCNIRHLEPTSQVSKTAAAKKVKVKEKKTQAKKPRAKKATEKKTTKKKAPKKAKAEKGKKK